MLTRSYEEALLDVGTVLSRYDEDNNYAVYGFGGEPVRRHYANHPPSSDEKSPLPSLSRMASTVVAQVQSESKEADAPASTTPTDKVKETMKAATEVLEAVEAAEASEAKAAVVESSPVAEGSPVVEGSPVAEGSPESTPAAEATASQNVEETAAVVPTEHVEQPAEPEIGSDMATISALESSDSDSQYASAESSTEEEVEPKPVDESAKVVDENSNPVEENAKTVEENDTSADENAKPVDENAKPVDENANTVDDNANTVDDNANTVDDNATPINENATPINEANPAEDNPKPTENPESPKPETPLLSTTDAAKSVDQPSDIKSAPLPISLPEEPNPTDSAKESPAGETTPVEVKEKKELGAALNASLAYLKEQSSFANSTRDFESKELSLELFPLNGNQSNPYIHGVNGVLKAYRSMVKNLLPSYPTYFQHILKEGIRRAKKAEETHGKEYVVLILISDCCIVDQVETLRLVVEASRLPMSLIILGMGDNDFHFMDVLDGDDEMPSLDGQMPARDVTVIWSGLRVDGPVCEIR